MTPSQSMTSRVNISNAVAAQRDKTVYVRTRHGEAEIASKTHGLLLWERTVLSGVDGGTPVWQLIEVTRNIRDVPGILSRLMRDGYVVKQGAVASDSSENAAVSQSKISATDDEQERVMALKSFFNETIKKMLGFRGIMLQLRVEKAYTLDEFGELREPFLAALSKGNGSEIVNMMRTRMDTLLGPST